MDTRRRSYTLGDIVPVNMFHAHTFISKASRRETTKVAMATVTMATVTGLSYVVTFYHEISVPYTLLTIVYMELVYELVMVQ